jgi:hypothetical protein
MSCIRRDFLAKLGAPVFLLSLATLLLNDFVFKPSFPGMVTGKLSDLAGLFAFGCFWCSLLAARKTLVLTAIELPVSLLVPMALARNRPLLNGRLVRAAVVTLSLYNHSTTGNADSCAGGRSCRAEFTRSAAPRCS